MTVDFVMRTNELCGLRAERGVAIEVRVEDIHLSISSGPRDSSSKSPGDSGEVTLGAAFEL